MKPVTLVIVLAVLAGGIGLFVLNDQQGKALAEECPGHWHAGYTFFVNNQRVQFTHPSFQSPVSGHAHHIHANDGVYHYHPGRTTCTPLTDVGEVLDFSLSDASLTLGAKHAALAGTYLANETAQLNIFLDPHGSEEWRAVTWAEVSGTQLKNGDRILITYGNLTPEVLAAQKAQATDMSRYVPTDV